MHRDIFLQTTKNKTLVQKLNYKNLQNNKPPTGNDQMVIFVGRQSCETSGFPDSFAEGAEKQLRKSQGRRPKVLVMARVQPSKPSPFPSCTTICAIVPSKKNMLGLLCSII